MAFQDIKVEYMYTSDEMTDVEYENQEEKEFIVTQDMIYDLITQHIKVPEGTEICRDNFWIHIKK